MTAPAKLALLIAEDDPHIRTLLEAAAERSGLFQPIVGVADGEEALHAIQHSGQRFPELIVSDLSMPRMSGLDLLRTLKSDPATRSIPVAIITSSNLPNDREDALAAGATVFLPKALGFEEMARQLTSIRDSCCEHARAATE